MLDSAIGEVRQEALHVAELQRKEEQRLRRQGVELQEMFDFFRQQFTEVAAKSQRVDDVRRQLIERIEVMEEQVSSVKHEEETTGNDIDRVEKMEAEHYISQQERIESLRLQMKSQLGEMRQVGDQRMDRYMNRFIGIDDRLREIEQMLGELPSRFEALEKRRKDRLGDRRYRGMVGAATVSRDGERARRGSEAPGRARLRTGQAIASILIERKRTRLGI